MTREELAKSLGYESDDEWDFCMKYNVGSYRLPYWYEKSRVSKVAYLILKMFKQPV